MFARIASHDPDEQMPPPDSNRNLSPKEITLLKEWIAGGAKWADHWTFQPIVRPQVKDKKIHPIDFLVEKRLENEKFKPTPRAERKTLIRRLSLDLTGLPPTLEQIDAFLADQSPDAYEKLVDRLLNSPHYGERWGRHWLDVARYVQGKTKVAGVDRVDRAKRALRLMRRAMRVDPTNTAAWRILARTQLTLLRLPNSATLFPEGKVLPRRSRCIAAVRRYLRAFPGDADLRAALEAAEEV